MKESDVKKAMVERIRKEGGYARRIEDRFSVGMPDTVFIPQLLPVIWIEVKIVDISILRPSARQLIELKRLDIPPHSRAFVVGWKDGFLYIHPPVAGTRIERCLSFDGKGSLTAFLSTAISLEWQNADPV